jgi:hypothetical protein
MKQLTIRGVGEQLHMVIKREAKKRGQSINHYVLSIIQQATGFGYKLNFDKEYTDLDHLAGTWTDQEFFEFQEILDDQRDIDEGIW